jgi:DNA (cytosine-5)-methyltransferase 1
MLAAELFAGCGGSSEGARRAGVRTVWAANHWRQAVDCFRLNHPETTVIQQDLMQADFRVVPKVDLLWASPACQGHSRAASQGGTGRRGSAPHHDALRSTAWAIPSFLEVHRRTPLAIIENVEEYRRWVLYPAWCAAMQALGYSLAEHIIDAADLGVPQSRKRLFIIASRSKAPLHLHLERREHVPFSTCIDPNATGWRPVAKCGAGVRSRVAAARRNFPRDEMVLSQYTSNHPGRSTQRPIGTVTTKVQWALVRGDEIRFASADELKLAQGFGRDYVLAGNLSTSVKLVGNSVAPPVAHAIIEAIRETG